MEGCTNRAWPIQPISRFLEKLPKWHIFIHAWNLNFFGAKWLHLKCLRIVLNELYSFRSRSKQCEEPLWMMCHFSKIKGKKFLYIWHKRQTMCATFEMKYPMRNCSYCATPSIHKNYLFPRLVLFFVGWQQCSLMLNHIKHTFINIRFFLLKN